MVLWEGCISLCWALAHSSITDAPRSRSLELNYFVLIPFFSSCNHRRVWAVQGRGRGARLRPRRLLGAARLRLVQPRGSPQDRRTRPAKGTHLIYISLFGCDLALFKGRIRARQPRICQNRYQTRPGSGVTARWPFSGSTQGRVRGSEETGCVWCRFALARVAEIESELGFRFFSACNRKFTFLHFWVIWLDTKISYLHSRHRDLENLPFLP